jgi:RimJ/RimL family protein N-acetyltransferase
MDHLDALWEVGDDPELWHWTITPVRTRNEMKLYMEEALRWQSQGTAVPFATIEKAQNRVVGTTRFANIVAEHRRVEIGWTFVARPWQRTVVNTEAKYLMLEHAFETWQCNRVELKTNSFNSKSRAAMLRLGAKEEGTLRSHMVNPNGTVRDTVYFSVIASEWPAVRERLNSMRAPSV